MIFDATPDSPGSLTTADAGSGVAVPPGLESVLEYNSLLLNTQTTADRYHVTSIDGLSDSDIRDVRDINTDDHGETPFNSFYGGRTIVINGVIKAYTIPKLRDMQRDLRTAFIDITKECPLHFRTGNFENDVVLYCKKTAPIAGIEQQANLQASRDFQITLRCSNPRFLSYYVRSVQADPAIPTPIYTYVGTVYNLGNFEACPIIRFYGPMTYANLYNDATKQTLKVLTIGDQDYLEFDMTKRTLRNSLGLNMWNQLADDSDYMSLAPGENYFEYTGDCPRILMRWRDSWM